MGPRSCAGRFSIGFRDPADPDTVFIENTIGDLATDADRMERVARLTTAWRHLTDLPAGARPPAEALADIRWLLEELRVSYFAQTLGTSQPVSEQRVLRAIERLGS